MLGGLFTITKPVTIDCSRAPGPLVTNFLNTAILIDIDEAEHPNAVVTLRGLTIDGFPTLSTAPGAVGIRFIGGGAALHVEDCKIFGFAEQGIDFRPTSSVDLFIRDTVISNNASTGVRVGPAGGATVKGSLSRVSLDSNGGIGLLVSKAGGSVPAAITVDDSNIEKNLIGLRATGVNASILLNGSTVAHNVIGLQTQSSGKIISFGNNSIRLNTNDGAPTSSVPLM